MEIILESNRRRIGDFEVVEFVDERQIESLRTQLDVDVPLELHWTWEYGSEVEELRARASERLTPVIKKGLPLGGSVLHYSDRVREMEVAVSAYLNTPHQDRHAICVVVPDLKAKMDRYYRQVTATRVSGVRLIGETKLDDDCVKAGFVIEKGGLLQQATYYLRKVGGA